MATMVVPSQMEKTHLLMGYDIGMRYKVVVWNMNFVTFHILGIIIPTDFHIFRGVETTNQIMICMGFDHEQLNNGDFLDYKTNYNSRRDSWWGHLLEKTTGLFEIMNQPIRGTFST